MSTANQRERVTTVLAVSPHIHDQVALRNIFSHSNWRLRCVQSLEEAWKTLHQQPVSVVISEHAFPDGLSWKDLLEEIEGMPETPPLIVASREADEGVWAEVLNAGAFDLLSKPFQANEVLRVIGLALRQFRDRRVLTRRVAAQSGRAVAARA